MYCYWIVDDTRESHTWSSNMQLLKMNNKLPGGEQKKENMAAVYILAAMLYLWSVALLFLL